MKHLIFCIQHIHPQKFGLCLLLSFVFLTGLGQAYASESFTVSLYSGLDLATEMVELDRTVITLVIGESGEIEVISTPPIDHLFTFSPQIDLYFGLSLESEHPIEVVGQNVDGMVVLEDMTNFDAVTENMLADLDFTDLSVSIDSNDIVVFLTENDIYWMISNVVQDPNRTTVQFDYQKVTQGTGPGTGEIPEPTTFLLLGAGIIVVITFMKHTKKPRVSKGGRFMKHIKTLLLGFVLAPLLVGTAMAAEVELQVIVIGHGFVQGERFGCRDNCKKMYEEGTIVHLKAIPLPDSRFEGWKVDGEPHEGIIEITKDTVVSAIFTLKTEAPADELTVTWYNGDFKEQATIALDEMVIFLEDRETWEVATEEEYQAEIRKIVQTFHPQAESIGEARSMLFLKSPEPLDKDLWFKTLFSFRELKYVKYAGPVLYKIPGYSGSEMILFDQISVKFPASYTEEQITAIEQEYGLVRIKSFPILNNVTYHAGSPLEGVDTANRLYESGLVEYAIPDVSHSVRPLSDIHDEFFNKQWHLSNTVQKGEDINVLPAWEKGYKGQGIVIAIVDDGVEFAHPDLNPNKKKPDTEHQDFLEGDDDPIDNGRSLVEGASRIGEKSSKCPSACHGTAVAGASASRENSIGIRGIAPLANLLGYRTGVSRYSMSRDIWMTVFPQGISIVDIYNNSWGAQYARQKVRKEEYDSMVYGIENGRDYGGEKRGIIYVWSAGNTEIEENVDLNGDKINVPINANTNYYGFTNSRYTIAVGASGENGEAHSYSAPGATVLVNAPSGIVTTDRLGDEGYNFGIGWQLHNNYWNIFLPKEGVPWNICEAIGTLEGNTYMTEQELLTAIEKCLNQKLKDELTEEEIEQQFTTYKATFLAQADFRTNDLDLSVDYTKFAGTSAAAPVIAGGCALLFQAKPELTWRDVQHILIESAEKNRGETGDILEQEWQANTNAAGYSHLHKYGFGRFDAAKAVELAESWELVSEEITSPAFRGKVGSLDPSLDGSGEVSVSVPFEDNLNIEFVEVTFTSDHPRWGDLAITLTSPAGTESVLAETIESGKDPYGTWRFGSRRHFGEYSQGEWTLRVKDQTQNGDIGTFFDWDMKVYGTELPMWKVTMPTEGTCCESEGEVVCTFDEDKSSMILHPTGVNNPNVQYLFANDCEALDTKSQMPQKVETGTSWFPKRSAGSNYGVEIAVNMTPEDSWFPEFEPQTVTRSCDEGPPDARPTETLEIPWTITSEEIVLPDQKKQCNVTFTIAGKQILAAFQTQGSCESTFPTGDSGSVQAKATYGWKKDEDYIPQSNEYTIIEETESPLTIGPYSAKYLRTYNTFGWTRSRYYIFYENPEYPPTAPPFSSSCPPSYPAIKCRDYVGSWETVSVYERWWDDDRRRWKSEALLAGSRKPLYSGRIPISPAEVYIENPDATPDACRCPDCGPWWSVNPAEWERHNNCLETNNFQYIKMTQELQQWEYTELHRTVTWKCQYTEERTLSIPQENFMVKANVSFSK